MSATQRIIQYPKYKSISTYKFYKETGLSNSFLDKNNNIDSDKCAIIIDQYPDINPIWLLTEKGEMIVGEKKYAEMSDNTHLNIASDHKTAYNSDLVAYLERKLDEKTRECYDLQAKIEGLASELRRRKEVPAQEQPLADVG